MTQQIHATPFPYPSTITNAVPVGAVGFGLTASLFAHTMKPRKAVVSVTVSAPTTLSLWMLLPIGITGDTSDDVWGLFQDMFGVIKLGVLATALPAGTYHFIIPDIGGFSRLYLQSTAGTVTAVINVIQETSQA